MNQNILKTCKIANNSIQIDGETVFVQEEDSFGRFIKAAYKNKGLKYPKFHKMDRLCKLAFMAAYYLLGNDGLENYKPDRIGLVMANASSTLVTDSKHAETIADRANYYPSPSNFVYTLPNILIGEICIFYGIKGESVFFVQESADQQFLLNYTQVMLDSNKMDVCITGWAEYTETNYEAVFSLINK